MKLRPAVFACALWSASLACSSVARADLPEAQVLRIDAVVTGFASANHVTAIGVGIAHRGRPLYERNARAVFGIGSITKQFTAVLVLMLADEGKIDLQAPVARYVPGYPKAAAVTVRQLLDQTSGIPDYADDPQFAQWMNTPQTPAQLIERVRNLDLAFAPGTRFAYSNTNYVLLGLILENAGGAPFATLVKQRLTGPLHLTATEYGGGALSAGYSAGGLTSNVNDLVAWQDALFSGRVLPPYLTQLMAGSGPYGFGLMHERMYGRELVGHSGSIPGFASYAALDPHSGLQIVVLANANADVRPLVKSLVGIAAPSVDGGEDPDVTARIAAALPSLEQLRAHGTPLSFEFVCATHSGEPAFVYRIAFEGAAVRATFALRNGVVTVLHVDDIR